MPTFFDEMLERKEKATNGRDLYEASRPFGQLVTTADYLLNGNPFDREWDELPWNEKDHWEAQADELNESRRGAP